MCGIAGFWRMGQSADEGKVLLEEMAVRLHHRGPDFRDCWFDRTTGLGLAHTRLSIIDLSAAGHQPMHSANGRFSVVYNGEIYNFLELRKVLEQLGHSFRGGSDTEVVLAAISEWGLEEALQRFNGMFAFALWDRERRELHLIRDRVGEKPLYYGMVGSGLAFGSELSALQALPGFDRSVDHESLALLVRHGWVPAPRSIYRNIRKVPAGAYVTLGQPNAAAAVLPAQAITYWPAQQVAQQASARLHSGTSDEVLRDLRELLRSAVRERLVADVPMGAFLSGGIDSSLVVSLMQEASPRPVRTFTLGFEEKGFDESAHARAIAEHLGTEHTELKVTAQEALAKVPELPRIYDEPFADPSQIPTHMVCALARTEVTVALSGDGGDELFGGYGRYGELEKIWRFQRLIPAALRRPLSGLMQSVARGSGSGARKVRRLGELLCAGSYEDLYLRLITQCPIPDEVVLGAEEPGEPWQHDGNLSLPDVKQHLMFLDFSSYLPDDVLVKQDRAAMDVALETRLPLLDHRLVEFAWRIPTLLRDQHSQGKWMLKQILADYVPAPLYERPKQGFEIPLGEWLRGPLRCWADDLLNAHSLEQQGLFSGRIVGKRWREHLDGIRDWRFFLWSVLMFQQWLSHQEGSAV